jgi:glycosyltransferase involved in cell wall biosynthesis
MRLSIVIPAHNEEAAIGDCLRAALREAHRSGYDVEVVVVNNASTDRTAAVAAGFLGVRVVDEPQKGLSMARDRGYRVTRGELIVNLDADTHMPRGYLRTVVQSFERDPHMVCLSGPFLFHDLPAPLQIGSMVFYFFQFLPNIVGQRVLRIGAAVQGGNFIVRRTALDRIGGYDTSIEFYGEDTDIAIRLSKVGRVRFKMRLYMPTSGRRLRSEGTLRTAYLAFLNIVFVLFYGRPFTQGHRSAFQTTSPARHSLAPSRPRKSVSSIRPAANSVQASSSTANEG